MLENGSGVSVQKGQVQPLTKDVNQMTLLINKCYICLNWREIIYGFTFM